MRGLVHVATLTGLPEISQRLAEAEAALRRGGILHPFPVVEGDVSRADPDGHFGNWMAGAEEKFRLAPAAKCKALRKELYGYAADIMSVVPSCCAGRRSRRCMRCAR